MALLQRLRGMVRCPACASVARHARDREREAEIREATSALLEAVSGTSHLADAVLEGLGVSPWVKRIVRAFVCGSCGHEFDDEAEVPWYRRAKQVRDDQAVAEYRVALGLEAPPG